MRVSKRTAVLAVGLVAATTVALGVGIGGHSSSPRAIGATPTGGTLSKSATSVTWTAGPFAVANASGTAGAVMCNTALPCDDYKLTVTTPTGYEATHALTISVSWPTAAADFDIYLLDDGGNVLASSASSTDPEIMVVPPNSGVYTVRVVPYTPAGQSITGTATITSKATNPPPSTATPPTYRNYPVPGALTDSHNSGEPSLGVDLKTNATMYQSSLSTYKVVWDAADNATWKDASASALTGCPQGSTTSLDPILFTDPKTGRTFESQLAGKAALTCYTDDDGVTWTPTQGSGINSGVDHQTLGGGVFAAGGVGALPTSTYPNAIYYCSQDIALASCSVSRDGGLTYGASVPMYSLLDCGGLHGHAKVGPDGTLYVPNKGCGSNQAVAVSTDNATSFTVRKNPSSQPGDSDPSVGIGANGSVYMGYQNADGTPRIAVSHDKGQTWLYDQNVGATLGIKNVVFPEVVAGDDNRAAFAYIGTTTGGNYQDATNFKGVWHLYISTTYDGGKSWVTVDQTPTDPVQRGSICTGGTTCGNDRNLLDFNDITIDKTGRVEVAWADGCTGTCAGGGAQNFDALATITRQTTGLTLLSAYDPKPDLTVSSLSSFRDSTGHLIVVVRIANIGPLTAQNVIYTLAVNGTVVTTSAPFTVKAGGAQTYRYTGSTTPTGRVTVLAVVDPNNSIAELDETNNKRTAASS